MKTILFAVILGMLAGSLSAQDDYDYVDRNSFSIVKTSLNVTREIMKSASSLRTSLDVESHCGSKYTNARFYAEMEDSYYTEYKYSDRLILRIPEEEGGKVAFTVTGDAYAMLLSNGAQVRIGMKGDELARIFPNSFANRKPISETRGKEGKIAFIVHMAHTIDNQIHREDAFIRFILNQNTGTLEEFYTYEPL